MDSGESEADQRPWKTMAEGRRGDISTWELDFPQNPDYNFDQIKLRAQMSLHNQPTNLKRKKNQKWVNVILNHLCIEINLLDLYEIT